jgi:hypothetical protein
MQKNHNNLKLRLINRIKSFFANNAVTLMYHRISDVTTDPWELAVSPVNFDEHLQVLHENFNIIPVKELVNLHIQKGIKKK